MSSFSDRLAAIAERGSAAEHSSTRKGGGKGKRLPWRGVAGKPCVHFLGLCPMPDGSLIDPEELRPILLGLNPDWDYPVTTLRGWMNTGSRCHGGTPSNPNVRISREHVVYLLHAIGKHSREQVADVIRVLKVPKICPKTIGSGPAMSDEELANRIAATSARIAEGVPVAEILAEIVDPIDEGGESNDGDN